MADLKLQAQVITQARTIYNNVSLLPTMHINRPSAFVFLKIPMFLMPNLSHRPVFQLSHYNIASDNILFKSTILSLDQKVTVTNVTPSGKSVVGIDLTEPFATQSKPPFHVQSSGTGRVFAAPIQADTAILSPFDPLLVLGAGQQLQVFNIELRAIVDRQTLEEGRHVLLVRWLSKETIGVVIRNQRAMEVVLWAPIAKRFEKLFDVADQIAQEECQITDLLCDSNQKWFGLSCMVRNQCPLGN